MGADNNFDTLAGFLIALGSLAVLGVAFIVCLVQAIRTRRRAWVLAAVVTPLVCIVLAVVAGAMALAHSRRTLGVSHEGPRQVTSTDNAVKLMAPAAWRDMPDLHDDAELELGDPVANEYLIVLREPKADFDGSLQSYAEFVAANMQEATDSDTELEFEHVSLGGCPGLRASFPGVVDRIRFRYDLTCVETADAYCQVVCWTTRSRFEEAKPRFDAALESFVALEGAPAPGEEQRDD